MFNYEKIQSCKTNEDVKELQEYKYNQQRNSILKQYIIQGYAVNANRMNQLGEVIRIMKRTENSLDAKQVLSVIEKYSLALDLLDDYDHQTMKRLDGNKLIDDHTLVALTIMIAESKPDEKEMMISVIMNCICGQVEALTTDTFIA